MSKMLISFAGLRMSKNSRKFL